VIRPTALLAAIAVTLLAVAGAGGAATQQTPKLGGTIVVAQPDEPACLNPLLATCVDSSASVSFAVEKVLLPAFDVDGRFRYRPRLVSGVTVSRTPPVTLTYHIRPQARWSDGVPVTAADFVFTHAALLKLASSLPQSERAQLEHVQRVTAVGTKTVRVTLREPFSGWQALFPNVLPQHVLQGADLSKIWVERVDDPKTGEPIGDGPFLVESLERSKALTLTRNPQYWGAHLARVDRLVLRYGFEDAVDSLMRGDLDMAFFMPAPSAARFRNEPAFRVVSPPSAGYEHLAMRLGPGGHPALRNPLVRRALAYGIDRAAIVRAVAGPREPLQSVVFLVQSPYQRRNWQQYEQRPALAGRLLARAGCRRGVDGIYRCAGRRLSLRFVTSPVVPSRPIVMTTVQAQLRRVGVEVVPTYATPKAFFETILPRGHFDVALFGWFFDPNPAAATTIYACNSPDNYTGYCSRSVSRALDHASRMLDPAAQARILNAADRWIAGDAPVLPLYQGSPSAVVRTSVKAFVRLPYNPFADAENWWLDH
jgi:peptide/nickel transport system substrate-binding protein